MTRSPIELFWTAKNELIQPSSFAFLLCLSLAGEVPAVKDEHRLDLVMEEHINPPDQKQIISCINIVRWPIKGCNLSIFTFSPKDN